MKKGLWFKAKTYGWGWTPISWQGWLVIAIFIASILILFNDTDSIFTSDTIYKIFLFTSLTLSLITICYLKGEKPEWRWGNKPTSLSTSKSKNKRKHS